MLKRLLAYLSLALRALVLHPLRMLVTPAHEKGKLRFLANYTPEGLLPYSPEERAWLPRFAGCINCGVCDVVCPIVMDVPPIFAMARALALGSGAALAPSGPSVAMAGPGAPFPLVDARSTSPIAAGRFRGPSAVALAYSRATPELRVLRSEIAALDGCGTCRLCQDACPRGVPLLEIFAFTKRKLAQVDQALARSTP